MSSQTFAGPNDPYYLSSRGVNKVSFNKLSSPPLAITNKGILYELEDGVLYWNGTGISSAGGTLYADGANTTGDTVVWKDSASASAGQVIKSTSSTLAEWAYPGEELYDENTFIVDKDDVSARLGFSIIGSTGTTTTLECLQTDDRVIELPDASTMLIGTDTTDTLTNKTITDATNDVAANSLKSATTIVSVSGATAPTTGQVLTATSDSEASWQTPISDVAGPGSSTDNALARFNGTTGKLLQGSKWIMDDDGYVTDSANGNPIFRTVSTIVATNGNLSIGDRAGAISLSNFLATTRSIFIGVSTGAALTSGASNVAIGYAAFVTTTNSTACVVVGDNSFRFLTTGSNNVSLGYYAGEKMTSGSGNTFIGRTAGQNVPTGNNNVIIGISAGSNLTSGNSDYNIYISSPGPGSGTSENNTIRIGSVNQTITHIAGIHGVTPAGATQTVIIDSDGQLGSTTSPTVITNTSTSGTANFLTSAASSWDQNVNWSIERVGNIVTLNIDNASDTLDADRVIFSSALVPAGYLPTSHKFFPILVDYGSPSTTEYGVLQVNASTGKVSIGKVGIGFAPNSFTGDGFAVGWIDFTCTWLI